MTFVLFVVGLGLLIGGAELLVRGAARLAAAFGISPLVIGLTVVSFGTSSPELAVSMQSAFSGQADIALGNVIGSNIFNVLFILGLSAIIVPLVVAQQLVRRDVPIMIGISIVMWLMALDGLIGRLDGILLSIGIAIYIGYSIWQSRRESAEVEAEYAQEYGSDKLQPNGIGQRLIDLAMVGGGLAMLIVGSNWLVDGAVVIARMLGVSELVIGLTIIAVGTSLPEVAASLVAALRGERDIAVGNVVGSNLFNILAILGLTAAVAPGGIAVPATALTLDIPVMVAVAIACLPIFFTDYTIARWEGVLFFAYYIVYTVFLVLTATGSSIAPLFSSVLFLFLMPLTGITLAVLAMRALRAQRQARASS